MRLPDFRNVVIDGTLFVDAGAAAQSRYIGAIQDAHSRREAKNDPGALTAGEIERLDKAEAKLAEAQAAHDIAMTRWSDLLVRGWHGQPETILVNGIKQKAGSIPTEADVSTAALAKAAAERSAAAGAHLAHQGGAGGRCRPLGPALPGRAVDQVTARWLRRREAERGAPAKGR